MHKTIKIQAKSNFDPHYGFKLIRVNTVLFATFQTNGLVRLQDTDGTLLGTCGQSEFVNHFEVI